MKYLKILLFLIIPLSVGASSLSPLYYYKDMSGIEQGDSTSINTNTNQIIDARLGFIKKSDCEKEAVISNFGVINNCYIGAMVKIDNFDPKQAKKDDIVTINGTNLFSIKKVLFKNINAEIVSVDSTGTQIKVKVPNDSIVGKIGVYSYWRDYDESIDTFQSLKEENKNPVSPPSSATNSENKSVYNLIAPIGSLKCIDTAKLDPNCAKGGIGDYLNLMVRLGIGLCAALSVLLLVINGFMYMGDESVFGKTEAKSKILACFLGLTISLGAYALLNTINPELVGSGGISIEEASIEVYDRADDTEYMANLEKFDTSKIKVSSADYSDPFFLGYLAHQQGAGGASIILKAAREGLNRVASNSIYNNMVNNFNKGDALRTIGTSTLTPENFLRYWATKMKAAKATTTPPILPAILTQLQRVASETGVALEDLKAMCRVESYRGCTQESSITHVNSGGYAGLFQLSATVFKTYGKSGGNILNAYDNAYAAAKYVQYNLAHIK